MGENVCTSRSLKDGVRWRRIRTVTRANSRPRRKVCTHTAGLHSARTRRAAHFKARVHSVTHSFMHSFSSVTQHARHAHAQVTRETHHTRCTTSHFLKWYSALCPLLLFRPSSRASSSLRDDARFFAHFFLCLSGCAVSLRRLCLFSPSFSPSLFQWKGARKTVWHEGARVVQSVTFRGVLVGAWRSCNDECYR